MNKPQERPARPFFSSGPTAKPPGWIPDVLRDALLGRSHRAKEGIARLQEVVDRTRDLLSIPADYRIGIVPASDTGAIEMALWSLLGPRPVDVMSWENFGSMWVADVVDQLKLKDGSRVGIIGGGPAGSFFSYFLMDIASRVGLELNIDIYEPRNFFFHT